MWISATPILSLPPTNPCSLIEKTVPLNLIAGLITGDHNSITGNYYLIIGYSYLIIGNCYSIIDSPNPITGNNNL